MNVVIRKLTAVSFNYGCFNLINGIEFDFSYT